MKLSIRRDLVKLSTPILFEQVFVNLLGVVNAIMASRVSKEAVSAIGMADAINSVVIAVMSALAIGATVVVAQFIGRGDREGAASATQQGLASGVLLAVVLAVSAVVFREPLLHFFYGNTEPAVMSLMKNYFAITALSYPLSALTLIGCGALRGAGETHATMKVNTLMNVLNVIFSYVLIYGMHLRTEWLTFTIPGYGVTGAGEAITLARAAGCIYLFWAILRQGTFVPHGGRNHFRFEGDMQRAIFAIGIPASVESLIFNGGKLLVQVMIVGMGTAAVAANYIAFSIANLINIPGAALAVALTTMVGHDIGRGDDAAAERTMWHVLRVAWVCMIGIGLIFIPFAPYVVGLYSRDAVVIDVGTQLVRLNCIFLFCYPTTFILPNGLKGAGDARYTMLTTLIGMVVFRIVLGYLLGIVLGYGVVGVWLGIIVDWVARSVLYLLRLRGGKWKGMRLLGKRGS
ncbi:MAG: putative multidrug resistance protein [Rhodocyclales bacterium]|nr:putative multidrug resistance protein [Rhodocyclales bacterium]